MWAGYSRALCFQVSYYAVSAHFFFAKNQVNDMNIKTHTQKTHQLIPVVLLFMVTLLAGCSTINVGRNFDMKAFESMAKVGETTKEQVRNKMGSPKNKGVSISKDGERLVEWLYFYASGKLPGMDNAKLKILQIRFDKGGILCSYNWTN